MLSASASRTAAFMALFRALETARPRHARLFADPFAIGFLPPLLRALVQLSRTPFVGALVPRLIDWRWPGARASGVARTRLIDDLLAQVLDTGIEQIVILGAGFDCRAYRIPDLAHTRVFEVDQAGTLSAKRRRLGQLLRGIPAYVRFVELDFNQQSLESALRAAGYRSTCRTCFIWEGVTNYLTAAAVDETLRFIGSAATGSRVLFTYVQHSALAGASIVANERHLSGLLRRVGEPWTFGLDPAELPAYLMARGLRLIEDIGSREYRARYMRPDGYHMRGFEFYHVVSASVGQLSTGIEAPCQK